MIAPRFRLPSRLESRRPTLSENCWPTSVELAKRYTEPDDPEGDDYSMHSADFRRDLLRGFLAAMREAEEFFDYCEAQHEANMGELAEAIGLSPEQATEIRRRASR